ncbi:glutathione synthase [Pollutimonas nitritireducens]|uniref:Glutathione synthetase n=1 Tax=Pollutimonas nitritireducens TaxID=2045209 RepID=A0A2N4UC36_9BURK|nr:glutathione synthase [Pollutimonas nitritireducens]PLC52585.1 glutathione synthase [Pollutimonas nitritireducens]
MHVLFVIDPLLSLRAYKDSSVAMMRALTARGHTLSVTHQGDLYIDEGTVKAVTTGITLVDGADLNGTSWWRERGASSENTLSEFDAVLMRKDPPFDMEYVYATHLLQYAQTQGARVVNSPDAIRNHPEKLAIIEFSSFTAPTLVTRDIARLRAFHRKYQDVIVKPLDGMGGTGIFRLREAEHNVGAILETLTDDGTRTIMAQRYIPEILLGDKRILLIAGKPVPYALARVPLAGETRGNLAAGGQGMAQPLSARDLELANAIGPKLNARGLLLVGLDVIGDYITEINVTSPTCFVEITEQTGFDVADCFATAVEQAVGI